VILGGARTTKMNDKMIMMITIEVEMTMMNIIKDIDYILSRITIATIITIMMIVRIRLLGAQTREGERAVGL
jgi:hypothetical protein